MLKHYKLVTNNYHEADGSTLSDRTQSKHYQELSNSFLKGVEISLLETDGWKCVLREAMLEASEVSLPFSFGSRGELLSLTIQNEVQIKPSNHAVFPLKKIQDI